MACTEAVETVIGEHYNEQLEQLNTAVANESQQAPAYALLSAVIAGGCRWAIG